MFPITNSSQSKMLVKLIHDFHYLVFVLVHRHQVSHSLTCVKVLFFQHYQVQEKEFYQTCYKALIFKSIKIALILPNQLKILKNQLMINMICQEIQIHVAQLDCWINTNDWSKVVFSQLVFAVSCQKLISSLKNKNFIKNNF